MILFTMYGFLLWIWWEWEKKPEKYMYTKNKEKIPIWIPSHPPIYKIGGQLFSGPEKTGNKPDLP